MKIRSLVLSPLLTALLLTAGCVNHVKNISSVVQETERKVLSSKYNIKITPEPVTDASFSVTVEKLQRTNVVKIERCITKEIYTPYSGWRELYEIPSGLCLLPVSLCTHICFIVTFGMLPYDVPKSINNAAFAGMNPFLNWESDTRVEERLLEADKKTLSEEIVNDRIPVSQTPLIIKAGDFAKRITTDEFGSCSVYFLAVDQQNTFFPLTRKLSFILTDNGKKSRKDIILTREFLGKLLKARARINAYKVAKPSGKLLYNTVIELEKMKFDRLAYSLEEAELQRYKNNKQFQQDFKDAAQYQ